MKQVVAVLMAFLMYGCGTPQNKSFITFESNPTGAQISSSGQQFGQAPATIVYTFKQNRGEAVLPVTATWVSGAQSTVQIRFVGGSEGGFIIQRPANAPGLEVDAQIAMQLQASRDRARAEASDAMAGAAGAVGGALGRSIRK